MGSNYFVKAGLALLGTASVVSCGNPAEQTMPEQKKAPFISEVFTIQATYGSAQFPGGQCTSGVVQIKGTIEWKGHAKDWYTNAKNANISVGSEPKVGAIVVFPSNTVSANGHVGVITGKNASGNWVMKSMNDISGAYTWTTRPALEYANRTTRVKPTGYIYYKLDKY